MFSIFIFTGFTCGCSSSTKSTTQEATVQGPLYAHKIVEEMDQPGQNTKKMGFVVSPDTIQQYGAQNVLLKLVGQKCNLSCYADLWDNEEAFLLNNGNPYGKRTNEWQKQHCAFIADHLVASKISPKSEEIINHPLTHNANYKRWGGKRKP